MNAQNRPPKIASTVNRAPRPRSSASDRARAVRYFGHSTWSSDGSGIPDGPRLAADSGVCRSATARCRASAMGSCCSGIEDVHEAARRVLARELEENVFESRAFRGGVLAQLGHRAAGADLSRLDDPDAIAQ